MLESLGLEISPRAASVWLGLGLGLLFGAMAEASRFCLRRALVGTEAERRPAAAMWLAALASALAGTQAAQALGLIDLSGHRFLANPVAVVAIVAGGLVFGAGMVLARGCPARLTVLAATGNLRAALVVALIAISAHATMKGALAPLRTTLEGAFSPTLPQIAGRPELGLLLALALLALALHASGGRLRSLLPGLAIGALVPLGWLGTGWFLADDFDPVPLEALSFTAPLAETLFWVVAASAIAPAFGLGLVAGTSAGAAISSLSAGRAAWVSFTTPRETGRYAGGAILMGFGGVLAGGCTLGAGLSGIATLSSSAALALGAIILGAMAIDRMLSASSSGYGAPSTTQAPQPAE